MLFFSQTLLWLASLGCFEFEVIDVREFTVLHTVFVNDFNLESGGLLFRLCSLNYFMLLLVLCKLTQFQ